MHLTGGCLCGEIRYESSETPMNVFFCHCEDCRRSGGSLLHMGVMVPREGFEITQGTPTAYRSAADSGRTITRNFCATCGSGITNELEHVANAVVIKAGTLDDPSAIAPTYEVFVGGRSPWVSTDERLEKFEKGRLG